MKEENNITEGQIESKNLTLASRKALGTRISAVAERIGTRSEAAKVAGLSDDMLFRYIAGTSKVSFEPIARMCAATGVMLDWVWTGEGPMKKNISIREPGTPYDVNKLEDVAALGYQFAKTLANHSKDEQRAIVTALWGESAAFEIVDAEKSCGD